MSVNNPSNYRTHEIHADGKVFPSLLVRRCETMAEVQHTLNQPNTIPTDGTVTIKQRTGKDGTTYYTLRIVYTLPQELRQYRRRYVSPTH